MLGLRLARADFASFAMRAFGWNPRAQWMPNIGGPACGLRSCAGAAAVFACPKAKPAAHNIGISSMLFIWRSPLVPRLNGAVRELDRRSPDCTEDCAGVGPHV